LSFVPYVRGVIVSGSLVYGNASPKSDLDILVVVKHGYLWMARFLLSLVTYSIGKKRHGTKIADRICLNHFVSDCHLTIDHHSVYNAQTYARWLPLFSSQSYRRLFKMNAFWRDQYVWNQPMYTSFSNIQVRHTLFGRWCRFLIIGIFEGIVQGSFGQRCEHILETLQRWYMSRRQRVLKAGRIVLTEKELEFHPDSFERVIIEESNTQFAERGMPITWNDSGLL
jgi:hypothetical protein